VEPKPITMVEYYAAQAFNPVLIRVEEPGVWQDHLRKRRHLYERHLGIPLSLLRDRRVLEFGCNSGENALVLATFGARLTFVEPNRLVAPRLEQLVRSFDLGHAIEAFHEADIASFQTGDTFDVVVAEGFLSTLGNRDAMLEKILSLVKPGGFGIISFNDRCGGLLEMLKRAILFRAYALTPVADVQSDRALEVARAFFEEDFLKLNASRAFETWWRDTLVAPVYSDAHLWSFPEILAILQPHGAVAHGTSPMWSTWEHHNWYKNVPSPEAVHQRFVEDWHRNLFYFLTGRQPSSPDRPVPDSVIQDAAQLVEALSALGNSLSPECPSAVGAPHLLQHLASDPEGPSQAFGAELEAILGGLTVASPDALLSAYKASPLLRSLWGTAYHYLCFQKALD
jgi:SAM-dependent methyltransferase